MFVYIIFVYEISDLPTCCANLYYLLTEMVMMVMSGNGESAATAFICSLCMKHLQHSS